MLSYLKTETCRLGRNEAKNSNSFEKWSRNGKQLVRPKIGKKRDKNSDTKNRDRHFVDW